MPHALRSRCLGLVVAASAVGMPWGAVPPAASQPAVSPPPAAALACTLQVAPAGEPGPRLAVAGRVVRADGRPVAGAALHVYQTDAGGRYTPDQPMDEPHARLAGRLVTCADGGFELRTIRPGGYPEAVRIGGRERRIPAHIHLDVTAPGHAERRLQVVFADDPLLADPYWKDWVRRLDQPVAEVRRADGRLPAAVTIRLD
jgi:protocatechuate 3,4-dioxygenase beta subunit